MRVREQPRDLALLTMGIRPGCPPKGRSTEVVELAKNTSSGRSINSTTSKSRDSLFWQSKTDRLAIVADQECTWRFVTGAYRGL